jgi:hypothetical protein
MASMGSSYDQLPFNNSNMLALLTKEIKNFDTSPSWHE